MIDFERTLNHLSETGFSPIPQKVNISVQNAEDVLQRVIRYFTGDSAQWLPEYENVARWLADNHGRGLLCFGNCGRGKSLICTKIFPLVFNHYHRLIVNIYDGQSMNEKADALMSQKILCLDDVGTEEISNKFGNKRQIFSEIVDAAEKQGKLLLITTNLSIEELTSKYGVRTVDRLRAITTPVLFKGASLRK